MYPRFDRRPAFVLAEALVRLHRAACDRSTWQMSCSRQANGCIREPVPTKRSAWHHVNTAARRKMRSTAPASSLRISPRASIRFRTLARTIVRRQGPCLPMRSRPSPIRFSPGPTSQCAVGKRPPMLRHALLAPYLPSPKPTVRPGRLPSFRTVPSAPCSTATWSARLFLVAGISRRMAAVTSTPSNFRRSPRFPGGSPSMKSFASPAAEPRETCLSRTSEIQLEDACVANVNAYRQSIHRCGAAS